MRLLECCLAGTVLGLLLPSVLLSQPAKPNESTRSETKAAESQAAVYDEELIQKAGYRTDGGALLDYLRRRTGKEVDPGALTALINRLGAEEFAAREKAYRELLALGRAALPSLREADGQADAEVRQRAADLRQAIESRAEPDIEAAAARQIARTRPAGAVGVLLAYVPFASEPEVVDEIGRALARLAVREGKPEPSLLAALKAPQPLQRAVAGEGLARAGAHLPAVRPLLKDADLTVRLRVALALIESGEKESVPVLIDLLGRMPLEQLWAAEETLLRLAGDAAPSIVLGKDQAERERCRQAWTEWYETNRNRLDLAILSGPPRPLGRTVVVQQGLRIVNGRPPSGEVFELNKNKEVLWRFDLPHYPVDAQVVGPNRVLVAEYQAGCVTERDFKGTLLRRIAVGGAPIGVQRLANGNTFVVLQNRLVEFDRAGKEAFALQRPMHDIFRARKLTNGEVVFITNQGMLTRIDGKTQRPIKTFNVGPIPGLFGSIDVLAGGGVLVPQLQANQAVEFDSEGRSVAQFSLQFPNSVQRLPNGNTLVASQNARRIVEFDAHGTEVWSYTGNGMVFNARRR